MSIPRVYSSVHCDGCMGGSQFEALPNLPERISESLVSFCACVRDTCTQGWDCWVLWGLRFSSADAAKWFPKRLSSCHPTSIVSAVGRGGTRKGRRRLGDRGGSEVPLFYFWVWALGTGCVSGGNASSCTLRISALFHMGIGLQ